MAQFLITLYDGTDAEAPARRQATRPAHLAGLQGNVESGKLMFGGPRLPRRHPRRPGKGQARQAMAC